ncbi:acyl carrier protein [Roseibium porphyridii]|uniref:Acyl carrier protein n=1 Tax=Roseibium porphyridii TaxID=2866279 RepID=A0ABY8F1S5_9HYPH|nr:acyl carrier protein [Roseibium sp. KMA01]WFE89354.1 acyl carrier protein [Roseibium sp. KMA01]
METGVQERAVELSWLINWFREQNPLLASRTDQEMEAADFFAAEYIDSFGVIMLIEAAEQEFGISFDEDDFQNRDFSKVSGLADLIQGKRAA